MRFLKGVVALLAVLYPAACYLLALSLGGLEKWVCIPLLLSSVVHVCWLFLFCEEEWLDFGTAMFVLPMAVIFCIGLYFCVGLYFTTSYFSGSVLAKVAPEVWQYALLAVCSLLPYGIGFAIRKIRQHKGCFPTYMPPSKSVIGIFAFMIATPILALISFLAVEIYYISLDVCIEHHVYLCTPQYALDTQMLIYAVVFFAGLPLGLLGCYLFKKQSKAKKFSSTNA